MNIPIVRWSVNFIARKRRMHTLKPLLRSIAEGRAMWTTVSKILISQEDTSTCEASGNGSSG